MQVWRLSVPAFAEVLTGDGNRTFGARWNSPGRGVVYTSQHLSLAVLEKYVHLPPEERADLPGFLAIRISVPDDAGETIVSDDEFHKLMADTNPLAACRTLGDGWLARGADLVLRAPSIVVPEEHNIMLNPAHPRMRSVTIATMRPFRFDPRLAVHT